MSDLFDRYAPQTTQAPPGAIVMAPITVRPDDVPAPPAAPNAAEAPTTANGAAPKAPDLFDRYKVPEPDAGRTAARIVGSGAQGFNDTIADAVAAPFGMAAWATNKLGLSSGPSPVGPAIKRGLDYVATLPGRIHNFTDILNPTQDNFTDNRTSRFEPETTAEKTARGVGEGVGNALTIAVPAGAISRAATPGRLVEGVTNTLASQPVMQTAMGAVGGGVTAATDNPYLGAAASLAIPAGAATARRVVSPIRNSLSPQEQRLVDAARNEGIELTPGQATGSPTLKQVEATMAGLPLASGPMQNAFSNQRTQFNRAVLERAGVTADDASPETIRRAFQQAGTTFDDLAARTTVNADPELARDINRVAMDYGRRLETNVAPVFRSYMDDLEPFIQAAQTPGTNPQLTGEMYARIRSDIGRDARSTNNPQLRNALNGIMDALDDAVERSTTGPLRAEWQEARRQYQALSTIDKAMSGGTQAGRSTGDVPFNALTSAVRSADKGGFSRGRGQLNEMARIGDYLANKVPDSGTVGRGMTTNILTGGALFGGLSATGAGIPAAAAGAISPYIASWLYNTAAGRAYLTNQIAGRTEFGALYGSEAARQALRAANGEQNALNPQGGSR